MHDVNIEQTTRSNRFGFFVGFANDYSISTVATNKNYNDNYQIIVTKYSKQIEFNQPPPGKSKLHFSRYGTLKVV